MYLVNLSNYQLQGWTYFTSCLQGFLLSLDTHQTYVPERMQLINHKNDDVPWSNWILSKSICSLSREGGAGDLLVGTDSCSPWTEMFGGGGLAVEGDLISSIWHFPAFVLRC